MAQRKGLMKQGDVLKNDVLRNDVLQDDVLQNDIREDAILKDTIQDGTIPEESSVQDAKLQYSGLQDSGLHGSAPQDIIPDRLEKYFGRDKSPFIAQTHPFEQVLPRALALILSQGKDPASPALLARLSAMDWSGKDTSLTATATLHNAAFFQGLPKRTFFSANRFLQAVAAGTGDKTFDETYDEAYDEAFGETVDLEELCLCSEETILETLLAIKGVGPDTAETMILYAFNKPFIPVNAGLYRIANRHGGVPESPEREEIRDWYRGFFPEDVAAIRQTHSHVLAVARQFCKASKALCTDCPLHDLLPLHDMFPSGAMPD